MRDTCFALGLLVLIIHWRVVILAFDSARKGRRLGWSDTSIILAAIVSTAAVSLALLHFGLQP